MTHPKFRLLILSAIIAALFGAFASTTSAQTASYIQFVTVGLSNCSNTNYMVTSHVEFSIDKSLGDVIFQTTVRPDGSTNSKTSTLNNRTSPQTAWGTGYLFAATAFPYTTTFEYRIMRNGQLLGSTGIEVTCTGLNTGSARVLYNSFGGASEGPPDDRMNWRRGDFNAIAYLRPDGTGNSQFELYCWDANTRLATLSFVVTQADVDAVGTPSENTLVASAPACQAFFYVLTTGEYQLNIYSADELHVLISNSLNFFEASYQVTKTG